MFKGKHNWELIDKHEMPSGFEQYVKSGHDFKGQMPMSWWEKKVVYTFKCSLTGQIKQTEFSNPE